MANDTRRFQTQSGQFRTSDFDDVLGAELKKQARVYNSGVMAGAAKPVAPKKAKAEAKSEAEEPKAEAPKKAAKKSEDK